MIKKTILILLLILVSYSSHLFGIGWNIDFLIIKNDTLKLYSIPAGKCDQLTQSIENYFTHQPGDCTYSYWKLEVNRLYLVKIVDCADNKNTAKLSSIFGNNFKKERVFANWVSGELIHPHGKWIDFAGISTSEKEVVYLFSKGIFTKKYEYDNSKTYKSKFTQNTDSLLSFIYCKINWETLPNIDDSKKMVALRIASGEEQTKFQVSIIKGIDSLYNYEALRVAKLIPEWDVLYMHGQPQRMDWLLSINFSNKMKLKYKSR